MSADLYRRTGHTQMTRPVGNPETVSGELRIDASRTVIQLQLNTGTDTLLPALAQALTEDPALPEKVARGLSTRAGFEFDHLTLEQQSFQSANASELLQVVREALQ